jgi:hypothetical protein
MAIGSWFLKNARQFDGKCDRASSELCGLRLRYDLMMRTRGHDIAVITNSSELLHIDMGDMNK